MKKSILGGIITLVIGGAGFAVSKSDIVSNFSKNTGLSQQAAQQYVDNAQGNLDSFSNIGSSLAKDGGSILSAGASLDCDNYTYNWESDELSCPAGKDQLQTIGNDEQTLGNCYEALGTDLGTAAKSKISECIGDIDSLNASYNLPIAASLLDQSTIADQRNSGEYNKSVLQAALDN